MINYGNLDSDELLALAKEDFRRENYAFCLDKLKVILARNQIPVYTYSLLGRTYAVLELFERARDVLNVFLEHSPKAFQEQFHLGMVEKDLGNDDEAKKRWNEALEIEPLFPPALYHLAYLSADNNEIQEATQLLNRLIDNTPEADQHVALAKKMLETLNIQ